VPENKAPAPAPEPAARKSFIDFLRYLLNRWLGRRKLSEASPAWIALMALPTALFAALIAAFYGVSVFGLCSSEGCCDGSVFALCDSECSRHGFTFEVMLGLLLALAAVIPIFFLARSWRHYFIAAGCFFAGWLASTLTLNIVDPNEQGLVGFSVITGVGLGAGLGLGLGLARRTLSGAIGGLLLGQLVGIAVVLVEWNVAWAALDLLNVEFHLFGGIPPEPGRAEKVLVANVMGAVAAFGLMYLILLPGLAAGEWAAKILTTRAARKAAKAAAAVEPDSGGASRRSRRRLLLKTGLLLLGLAAAGYALVRLLIFPGDAPPVPLRRFAGHTAAVCSVAFSPDGRRFVAGGEDGTVRLWNVGTGEWSLRMMPGHESAIITVAFSPDGKRCISGSRDMRLWNVETGECLRTMSGHSRAVVSVVFSPDGRRALSGDGDATVRLWDLETGKVVRMFRAEDRVQSVVFSPDGRRALSMSWDGAIQLRDLEGEGETRKLEGDAVFVDFSPDGTHALAASPGKTLQLWEIETGRKVRAVDVYPPQARSFNPCERLALSPDCRRVLAAYSDGTIQLWDFESERLVRTFKLARQGEWRNGVRCVAFSPDGRHFLSGGAPAEAGAELLLWELPEE